MEGHRKLIGGGGGVLKAKFLEKMYENKLESPGGKGVQNIKPSVGGVWIFYGTAHFVFSGTTQCCVVNNSNEQYFCIQVGIKVTGLMNVWPHRKTKPECSYGCGFKCKTCEPKGTTEPIKTAPNKWLKAPKCRSEHNVNSLPIGHMTKIGKPSNCATGPGLATATEWDLITHSDNYSHLLL